MHEGRLLELIGGDAPVEKRLHRGDERVHVFPYWTENPFVNATYLAVRADGGDVVPLSSIDDLAAASRRARAGDVLHVHWTSIVAQGASDARSAAKRFRLYRRALRRFRRRGARIVWTAHNAIAHDAGYRDVEIAVNALTARTAHAIHVLNPGTADAMERHYPVDRSRLVLERHPSYRGLIPPAVPRSTARERFGIEEGRLAVLFFGQMRPYKGVDVLLRAIAAASQHRSDLTALLAGRTSPADLAAIEPTVPTNLPVVRQHEFVEDADVPSWFCAADVLVLPYRSILNSGSLMLAATYGVPCVLPDEPHLVEEYAGQEWVHFFDRTNPESSLAEILSTWKPDGAPSSSALRFASERDPFEYSERMAALLRPSRARRD